MSLGEEIRIIRQKAFYSQEAFAIELHVAVSTVSRWEMNHICPNLTAMKAIKEFCAKNGLPYDGIEAEWLSIRNLQTEKDGDILKPTTSA